MQGLVSCDGEAGMTGIDCWRVVSTYADGDRIVESVWVDPSAAGVAAGAIRRVRDDQDEAPLVTVEKGTHEQL